MDRYINYLMNEKCMSKNCRRVVTGFDETGESIIVSDEFVTNKMEKNTSCLLYTSPSPRD